MDEKKRDSASNLSQALKKVNAIEIYYAKIICMTSGSTRLKIYRKIASLHATITNDGKNPSEPLAIAIAQWGYGLQNGMSFSDALKGWAPDRERLMLSVGDVSDLEGALYNLIRVTEGTTKMIRPIISAISYPAFLMMMVVLIIYGIGAFMVPPMIDAAPNTRWQGTAKTLVGLSSWIQEYWVVAFSILPAIMLVIYLTIGIWTGRHYLAFGHVGAGQGRNAGIERHARFA